MKPSPDDLAEARALLGIDGYEPTVWAIGAALARRGPAPREEARRTFGRLRPAGELTLDDVGARVTVTVPLEGNVCGALIGIFSVPGYGGEMVAVEVLDDDGALRRVLAKRGSWIEVA